MTFEAVAATVGFVVFAVPGITNNPDSKTTTIRIENAFSFTAILLNILVSLYVNWSRDGYNPCSPGNEIPPGQHLQLSMLK